MRRLHINPLVLLLSIWGLFSCSSPEAPNSALSLAPVYHLKSVDGELLPIPLQSNPAGGSLDSGHVLRLGGDTIRVDEYSHVPPSGGYPGLGLVALGTWAATQFGNTVVLFPITASSLDSAFLGAGDTLRLRTHEGGALRVEVFVAP